jgi:2-oxoglutarate ferredoxin oxidoreductase subunit beta
VAKISQAIAKSVEWGDRIPIGVYYQNPFVPSFEERLEETRIHGYKESPPAKLQIAKDDGHPAADMDGLFDMFKVV